MFTARRTRFPEIAMLTFPSPPGPGKDLLTSHDVARRLSIGVRTLWRMVAKGRLPQPIRYTRKLVRWKASDIDRYIQGLSA
jgi:excisionase family DNA binding protein